MIIPVGSSRHGRAEPPNSLCQHRCPTDTWCVVQKSRRDRFYMGGLGGFRPAALPPSGAGWSLQLCLSQASLLLKTTWHLPNLCVLDYQIISAWYLPVKCLRYGTQTQRAVRGTVSVRGVLNSHRPRPALLTVPARLCSARGYGKLPTCLCPLLLPLQMMGNWP